MRKSRVAAVFAGVVIVGTVVAIRLSTVEMPPRLDARIPKEIGRSLAQEALKLLGSGGRLSVVTRDTSTFKQPALDLVLASVNQSVRQAGLNITSVQALQVDPLRPVQVPPGDFFELIRRAAPGDVIVSLMGPPWLTDEQLAGLGVVKPKIVAFCPGNLSDSVNLRPLVEQNLLHGAVLSRPAKAIARPSMTHGHEVFDDLYVRADRAELATLTALTPQP